MKLSVLRVLAVLAVWSAPTIARAQFASEGSLNLVTGGAVSGRGVVDIERQPEVLRLQVDVLGKAPTLKEALTILKDQAEAARLQAATLGAVKESIKVGDAEISTTKSDREQQIEQMLLQQMRARGRGKRDKQPMPVVVSASLTAEWKLKGKTSDELLLEIHELQTAIEKADLGGLEAASKLSPAEQEIVEEMEDSGYGGFGESEQYQPGKPVFMFAAAISPEDREQATAEAFAKAKAQADRLAKAAGAKLGTLKTLSGGMSGADSEDMASGIYGWSSYPVVSSIAAEMQRDDSRDEAVGLKPGKVKFIITVNASFAIEN